jgi:hypothetical protein
MLNEQLPYNLTFSKDNKRYKESQVEPLKEDADNFNKTENRPNYFEYLVDKIEKNFDNFYITIIPRVFKDIEAARGKIRDGAKLENYETEQWQRLIKIVSQMSVSLAENVDQLNIGDYEKNSLIGRIYLFCASNNLLLMQNEHLKKYIDAKKHPKNFSNILSAEAQQYVAIQIITSQGENFSLFDRYLSKGERAYGQHDLLPENISNKLKNGIQGAIATYQDCSNRGYRIVFPDPEIDASQKVDMIAVDDKDFGEADREILRNLDYKNLNAIPLRLRKYFWLVQSKCHANPSIRTEKRMFRRGIDKIDKFDYTSEPEVFFHMHGSGFNCLYVDLQLKDALDIIKKLNYKEVQKQ